MTRIEREKQTVGQMVAIYCRGHQHTHFGEGHSNGRGALCAECTALIEYAHSRLDHCKYGEKKPTCEKVAIKREQRKTRLPLPSVSKLDQRSSAPSTATNPPCESRSAS